MYLTLIQIYRLPRGSFRDVYFDFVYPRNFYLLAAFPQIYIPADKNNI